MSVFLFSLLCQNLENSFKLAIFETKVLVLHTAKSLARLNCSISFSNTVETGLLQDLLTDTQSEPFLLKAQNAIKLKKLNCQF